MKQENLQSTVPGVESLTLKFKKETFNLLQCEAIRVDHISTSLASDETIHQAKLIYTVQYKTWKIDIIIAPRYYCTKQLTQNQF